MGSTNDPIADLLTKIRNASRAEHKYVEVNWSNLKEAVVKILKEKGLIAHYLVKEERKKGTLRIFLKYATGRKPVIQEIKRVSRPSLRRYVSYRAIPKIMGGMGISILSTSQGVLEGATARERKLGGELICLAW